MKLLSLNLWMGAAELPRRVEALGEWIEREAPDVIGLQEVTHGWLELAARSRWFGDFHVHPQVPGQAAAHYFCLLLSRTPFLDGDTHPFRNSSMGRELLIGRLAGSDPITVATTHLESLPEYSRQRRQQLEESLALLGEQASACLFGDMNWITGVDPEPVLENGWTDAWLAAGHPHSTGLSYDGTRNSLAGPHRDRLDRVFCKLESPRRVAAIDLMGTEPIGTHLHISDHFGIAFEISTE